MEIKLPTKERKNRKKMTRVSLRSEHTRWENHRTLAGLQNQLFPIVYKKIHLLGQHGCVLEFNLLDSTQSP